MILKNAKTSRESLSYMSTYTRVIVSTFLFNKKFKFIDILIIQFIYRSRRVIFVVFRLFLSKCLEVIFETSGQYFS